MESRTTPVVEVQLGAPGDLSREGERVRQFESLPKMKAVRD